MEDYTSEYLCSIFFVRSAPARAFLTIAESFCDHVPLSPEIIRTGTISVDDMSMYLGDSFDRKAMTQYMRKISSRKDGLVRKYGNTENTVSNDCTRRRRM